MRKTLFALVLLVAIAPALAEAQSSRGKGRRTPARIMVQRGDCCWGNRFFFEPYAGALKDAYDSSPDEEDTGLLIGFRTGYLLSSRARLVGNIAYSKVDDVADPQGLGSFYIYDNTWIFTTAGGEFDVVPGRTSVSLGLQGGAAWRRVDLDGTVGTPLAPPENDDSFSAHEVLIPSLLLRHRLTGRATIVAGAHDNIFDFLDGPAKHSLALTAGIAFR
ncbi:MAG TPA: hypothetical protein VGD27_00680 [Longimicrobiales bacterium]